MSWNLRTWDINRKWARYCVWNVGAVYGRQPGYESVLGFIKSFSCDYCCLLCYATRNDTQIEFREEEFTLRTHDAYEKDLLDLARLEKSSNPIHFRGVKTRCVLNDLNHFKVTDNWVNDAMHTLLEGVILTTMGGLIFTMSNRCKTITFESINHHSPPITITNS
jgi:hypothetical protein